MSLGLSLSTNLQPFCYVMLWCRFLAQGSLTCVIHDSQLSADQHVLLHHHHHHSSWLFYIILVNVRMTWGHWLLPTESSFLAQNVRPPRVVIFINSMVVIDQHTYQSPPCRHTATQGLAVCVSHSLSVALCAVFLRAMLPAWIKLSNLRIRTVRNPPVKLTILLVPIGFLMFTSTEKL